MKVFRKVIVAMLSVVSVPVVASAQLASAAVANSAYFTTANTSAINPQQFTIEAKIRPDGFGYGNSGDGATFLAKPRQGSSGSVLWSWELGWSPATGKISVGVGHVFNSSATVFTSIASIAIGQTAAVAATFDGTRLKLYINGVLDSSALAPSSVVYFGANEPVLIGASNYAFGFTRRFQGFIDDVRIWDRARTAAEINSNFNCQVGGGQSGLVANWIFDSFSLADVSGFGRSASFVNLATFGPNLGGGTLPSITTHPASAATCPNGTATFSITALGTTPAYRRQRETAPDAWLNVSNGTLPVSGGTITISGAATIQLQLSFSNLSVASDPRFRCVVSSTCGSVTSNPATLTINACAPVACSLADIAGGGDTGLAPESIADGTDFIAFINTFSAGC